MHGTLKQRFASDFKDGVFVRAHVSHDTADAIHTWAKTLKLPEGAKLVDPDEYHATLIHSKTPFDYSNDTHDQVFPTADATNKRLEVLGADGEPKVLTLRFDSNDLKLRHDRLKEQGGKSDFPEFKPHITVAENVPADHDVSQHPVFDGPIVFTSESAEPIEKDKNAPSGHWPGSGIYSARGTDTTRGDHGRQDEKERARGDGKSDASRKRDRQGRDGGPSRLERREGDRDAARRWHVKAGDYDESKHPRDDHGRWTDAGGGGDGGDDTVTSHASGRIHELSANGAPRFHGAISAAKAASPYGAAVHVYPVEDYRNTRMFVTPDSKAGFALKGNDIVSLFKHPDHAEKGFAQTALALATEQGGQRLDAFDTQLPFLYSRSGFRAVARLAWNDQHKPDGWDYKTFGEFNGGRPDVVFMVHDPVNAKPYKPGDGKRVSTYEEGVAEQEKALAGNKSIPGLPSNVKIHDLNLNNAIDRGVWDITAKPRGYSSDKPGEAYALSIRAKQMPGIEEYKRRDSDKVASLYDPKLATLEVMDKGESFEWTLAKLKPGYSSDIHPLDDKDVIYRGMSAEEYRNILATGEVTSRGEYNLEGQEGLTYWSTQVDTAQAYANGFAPWAYKPTFEAPAYVIATKRPDEKDIRTIPGTGENEVGVAAPIKASDIVAVWRGQAYENRPGELDLVRIGYGGDDYRSGSGVGTSTSVAWIRDEAPGTKKDWDESKHPRVPAGSSEGGQFGEGGGGSDRDDHPGPGYSKDARVDKHGVIHTSNVYDAQRALFENRKVQLKQPKQVSTLIKLLGETMKRYHEEGQAPPLFDLCNVTVKGTNLFCAETKGIPRVEMPQMNTKQTKAFVEYLKGKGYDVEKTREKASHLRATQNQLSAEKVIINIERNKDEPERLEKRLVVSRDDYILDGHHHWAAKLALDAKDNKLNNDTKMRISRVDIDIITLLEEAEKFTGGKGKKPAEERDFRGPLAMELELTIEECEAIWQRDEAGLELGLTDREIELILLEWDESKHPRVPAGSPEGGQFGSGGGGGEQAELFPDLPKPKKKASIDDFTKGDVRVDRETTTSIAKQQKFLETWNEKIGEAPAEFRQHFLGGLNGTMGIQYDETNDEMKFLGDLHDADGSKIASYTREINFKRNFAESAYFAMTTSSKEGKGIGKDMLRGNIEMYQQLGLDKVIVHANIDVGGYAWAKYGYVPNEDSWDTLRGNIEQRLDGGGSRYSEYEPSSWEEMSSENQSKVEDEWREQAYEDVYNSEVDNWHESGRALFDAKTQVQNDYEDARGKLEEGATEYNADDPRYRWAVNALDKARTEANIPFTTEQLLKVTEVGYDDSHEEGRADPDITIDDSKLPDEGKALTDEMVDAIDKAMIDSFNGHAQDEESSMDPPAYVADSVGDQLSEIWSSMRDRDKFEWASRHSEITPIKLEDDSGDGEGASLDDLNPTEEKLLRKLIASDDPKTIWAIADATFGKKVLLNTDWNGALNFKDRESMERFNAYVGRKKAA
jgi:2'-5' RNA ligase